MTKLFDRATGVLEEIERLAESVAKDKDEIIEKIYEKIGFEPVDFLNCYVNPQTKVRIPVAGTYAEFSNINPLDELKADKKYFTKRLIKYVSENTKGKVYAGGLIFIWQQPLFRK